MQQTRNIGQFTLGRWHPQVRATGVENNLETLGRCTNVNNAIVLKYIAVGIMMQRFFDGISFSKENSNGTYRAHLQLRV